MKKNTLGRKLVNSFVREKTHRTIKLTDGENILGWVFISVNKDGQPSVYINENNQWDRLEKVNSPN